MKNPELWSHLQAFEIDDAQSTFNFTQRLARDNNWSLNFSKSVINEYKKFLYLCCVDYIEITPSDAVDQAWHLHLTYTKSYWIDLCKHTLGRQVHHNPTKGGQSEKKRFSKDYDVVQAAYLKEFNQPAPQDIWPTTEERFSNINFKRINLSEYWMIKKPNFGHAQLIVLLLPVIALLFIQSENPVPWGSLILVTILVLIVARTIKGRGKGKKRRGGKSGDSGGGFWGGFWGCSSDDHSGCGSGCSSGCGGGGCGGGD